jgi:hypothetical protein
MGKLLVQLKEEVSVCRLDTNGSMGGSLFMPALLGIIADKYFSAQKF